MQTRTVTGGDALFQITDGRRHEVATAETLKAARVATRVLLTEDGEKPPLLIRLDGTTLETAVIQDGRWHLKTSDRSRPYAL